MRWKRAAVVAVLFLFVALVIAGVLLSTFVLGVGQDQQTGGQQLGYSVGGAQDAESFRTNVENGYVPQVTDVTAEGLFQEYSFDTGMDDRCRELFCPAYSRAVTRDPLSNETEHYLAVGLNSNVDASEFERKKLNLVIVLDTSGSMDEAFDQYYYDDSGTERDPERRPKMAAARDAVVALTDHLEAGDRFGVVGYDDQARTIVEMGAVGDRDTSAVRSEVRSARAGGGTNLDAGMRRATGMVEEYAARSNASEYETRIVYVTDAMPNLGTTSGAGLGGQLEADADRGIYSTFVGVGVDFNTELVETISEVEGANYYSVDSAAQFRERMDEGFEYMVTPLVFDLSVSLDSEAYRIERVYGTDSDASTGRLLHVNTLFPSHTDNGSTRGGVILVALEHTGRAGNVTLSATYEDRRGREHEVTRTVTFRDREPDYFGSPATRKAVALARYTDLLRNWAAHERARASNGTPPAPPDGIDPGYASSRWEQTSVELRVSPPYDRRLRAFRAHLQSEMAAVGDDRLARELDLLERILRQSDDPGAGSADAGRTTGSGARVAGAVTDRGAVPSAVDRRFRYGADRGG